MLYVIYPYVRPLVSVLPLFIKVSYKFNSNERRTSFRLLHSNAAYE